MHVKSTKKVYDALLKRIRAAKRIVVISHVNPDGDSLGSMAAFAQAAKAKGKHVDVIVCDNLPRQYRHLFDGRQPHGKEDAPALIKSAELILIVDTCSFDQLAPVAELLKSRRDKIIVIDHHVTADKVGVAQWSDSTAAATGLLMLELLEHLKWKITPAVAQAIGCAILTDTGWLRFSNTDVRCLQAVTRLVECGMKMSELYRILYQMDRPQRIFLMTRMLQSMELLCNGKLAVMTLLLEDFASAGATPDETEDLINEAMRIASVELVVLIVQRQGAVRASFRSRQHVNVASLARQFGGGGHARAAGAKFPHGDVTDVQSRIVTACQRALS